MNNSKIKFLFIAAGIGIFFACNDPNTVGLEVLPSNDQLSVKYCDTLTLTSYTVREDSLSTSNNSANLAGYYVDPVFGTSTASFYAQLAPLKNSPNFGVEPKADSVILTLTYSDPHFYTSSYGDTTISPTWQTFNVYQVTQDLHKDSTYYSNTKFSYSVLLGSNKFLPHPEDSILNLRLDTSYFRTFILNQSGQTTLSSVSSFQAYFKGIYVVPQSIAKPNAGNRILYFSLASVRTRLHIYYHNATDTSVYDLAIDSKNSCATVNHFEHNYVGTPVALQLNDSSHGTSTCYVQSMAGVKTKIKMPYLKNFLKIGDIAINNAELVLTAVPGAAQGFYPITQLAVQGIDAEGKSTYTPDYYESISYRGGVYDAKTESYKTNITRYVQQVLTGKVIDNGLFIVVFGGSVFGNRSILNGSNPSNSERIKLLLTYSQLN